METQVNWDDWNDYIRCQCRLAAKKDQILQHRAEQPFVTISRQSGSGGITVAQQLVRYLREHDTTAVCPWTLFDKNLVTRVLEEHDLSEDLAEMMAESKTSKVQDILDELDAIHPSHKALVGRMNETIANIARMGLAVLLGRGANVITRGLPNGVHVRLIGSLERRVAHTQEHYRLQRSEALRLVRKEDADKKEYLKKYFGRDIDDPMLYDLTINTDRVSYEEAVRMISAEVFRVRTDLVPV